MALPQVMVVSICESTTSEQVPDCVAGGESNPSEALGCVPPDAKLQLPVS